MKICFLGKYPPIEGGVSATNYWLAHGLAKKGHEIHVVTNAREVEPAYRMHLDELSDPADAAHYESAFPSSGGSVVVHATEAFSAIRMEHIPRSNPFVTKLASVATETIRLHACNLVFAYYYEPYAVAGHLAATWTGTPLVVKHAGSDLDRLMRVPGMATTYKEILRRADAVVTRRRLIGRFLGFGVRPERLRLDQGFGHPRALFHPEAPALDVESVLRSAGRDCRPFDPTKPTLGIYGKIGTTKGSFDLVAALGALAKDGLDFQFLAMTQGRGLERFEQALADSGLEDRTWLLPFLPHWKVPGFIRACTAVCFLERDFPIKIHGPMIPREVLCCGTCLVLSREIADKQFYRDDLEHGENVFVVEDPKDHSELAGVLRTILQSPEEARAVGARGHRVSERLPPFSAFVDGFEALFLQVLGHHRVQVSPPPMLDDLAAAVGRLMPWTAQLLPEPMEVSLGSLDIPSDPTELRLHPTALRLCERWEKRLEEGDLEAPVPHLRDVLRFQKARLLASFDPEDDPQPAFSRADRLPGHRFSPEGALDLRPLRSRHTRVVTFDHDITPLFTPAANGDATTAPPARRTHVLFHRSPNLLRSEHRLTDATYALWKLCTGEHTTRAILEILHRRYGDSEPAADNPLESSVLKALESLYRSSLLVFTDGPPPGASREHRGGESRSETVKPLAEARFPHHAFEGS